MVKFNQIPYIRPEIEDLERDMESGLSALAGAKRFEEAYYALLRLEEPRRRYMTLSNLCEIHNTMDTTDPFWAEEAAHFDRIRPRWEAIDDRLGKALTSSPYGEELKVHLGEEIFRRARVVSRAFSPDIAAEQEEENRLSARYSSLTANLAATVDGKQCTLGEMARMRDDGDRASRMKFDLLGQAAYAQVKGELDTLYDDLVKVRHKIAGKLGQRSFTEVGYCRQCRTGYGREEAAAFRREVETGITPVVSALFEAQRQRLRYDTLLTCDEDVSFAGPGPKPFDRPVEELFDPVFAKLSPESKVFYEELRRNQFYDLGDRRGKIRGAYSNLIPNYRLPFVFETFDASPGAVKTFAHECGHGLHSFLKRGEPFIDSANASGDLCEIHSMAMEFFIWPHLEHIYPAEDIAKYRYFHMKSALSFLPYGAAVDEFQTRVYDQPDLGPAGRLQLWKELEERYLPWRRYQSGGFLEEGRAWQRQTHIYKWPFYYIDYALAQTCALQYRFWDEENHSDAWESYLTLVRESDRHSFSETLALAGLESPFQPGVVSQVGKKAMEFLEKNTL